jgi:hypothetical protein
MKRPRQRATSLIVAGTFLLGACDIDGVTPNCSDAGECATPPGTSDPAGGTGNAGGTSSGGSGRSTAGAGGATGGNGGNAGTGNR